MSRIVMRFVYKLSFAVALATTVASGPVPLARAQSTGPSAALSQKSSDSGELMSKALSTGHVRVIVSYDSPVAPNALRADNPSALADLKSRNARIQDAIISAHISDSERGRSAATGQSFGRGLMRYDYTPNFATNVTPEELEALASDPRVTHIQYDKPEPPQLFDSVPLIGMTNPTTGAWAKGAAGSGQMVAVLDTGVQSNHQMLAGKVIAEACFSNANGAGGNVSLCPSGAGSQTGTGAASPLVAACISGGTNICTHGTHVAGEAAGYHSGSGIAGVAKSANVFAIQVFTRFNDNGNCNNAPPCVLAYNSDQLAALNHVIGNQTVSGNKVASVNMSLGGGSYSGTCDSDSRKSAIDTLRAAGILTAIASGNNGYTSSIGAPGCISTAVTVGSVTKAGNVVSYFSNMSNTVDLLGPGGGSSGGCSFGAGTANILGPVPDGSGSTNQYSCFQGTSMATPHVAGAIAALKSYCTLSVTSDTIESALKTTGLSVTDSRGGGSVTKPRIRVDQAVSSLASCRAVFTTQTCTAGPTRLKDFSGDNKADYMMRRADGTMAMWLMDGVSAVDARVIGQAGTEWTMVGTGDFNGDGKADFLMRRSDGTLVMYLMNGFTTIDARVVGQVGMDWTMAGTGDFNRDGKADFLMRRSDGSLAMYLMNGFDAIDARVMGQVGTEWTMVGLADFNGDGRSDFLMRRADGTFVMYLMDGFNTIDARVIGVIGTEWSMVGIGDFNGDGKADFLMRRADGALVMFLMNGFSTTDARIVGVVGTEWGMVGVGDFNGDRKADFLMRRADGSLAVYLMDGFNAIDARLSGQVGTEWTLCYGSL